MCTTRFLLMCLLLLCVGIACQAFTFERVSSSYSFEYDISLDCTDSDPGDRDWNMSYATENSSSSFLSLTPRIKHGTEWLVDLDHLQWAETNMYYDSPGGATAANGLLSDSIAEYNRIYTSVHQRPVLTFYQPSWYTTHSYLYSLTATTTASVFYQIKPLDGENIGDEVILTVEGWTELEQNSNGPKDSAILPENILNSADFPTFMLNGVDMGPVNGIVSFTAHIGDTMRMQTSVFSSVDSTGGIIGWPSINTATPYMPSGLFASSSISVTGLQSPTTVPEPSSLIAVGFPVLMLGLRNLRKLRT